MKPRIAITASLGPVAGQTRIHLPLVYAEAVDAAGGRPVVLPPTWADASADDLARVADGLLLAGGDDLDPALWGEPAHPAARLMDTRRQKADLGLIALADACGLPVLGICLGCQEMAVARGGRLIQHVPDEPGALDDHGGGGRPRTMHTVAIDGDSLLARAVGPEPLDVNSSHHQAVREAGRGLRVVARSPDGLIEAIEDPAPGRFFLAIQWHPELLADRPRHLALFQALCRAAAGRLAP
ncbi:MAG: gamma-glutamyl-gamma-aminobutyrate hydrolase family protein [Planctomycetes bacterium]|nr:gamma-glutamyl-gamma-aminobutyrate hydrolase family protein [Planctomycetota bacterium]